VVKGYAKLVNPWTVEIALPDGGRQTLTARSIVIAAGAAPVVPDLPGLDAVGYLTSDTLWEALANAERAPSHLLVLGGGPIGCELAQAFARLGVPVTLLQTADRLLVREDEEVSDAARQTLEREGVRVLLGHKTLRCEREGNGMDGGRFLVAESSDGQPVRLGFDAMICAIGRKARLTGYGLESLGIPVGRTVETNDYLQTLYPNIYAAGDVAGPYQFTHMAAHQAWYATVNALFSGFWRFKADYSVVPAATFMDPEIARVGLNEREARERNIAHEVTRYHLDDLDRAIADGDTEGFVKVLTAPRTDRILGVTIVGRHAADLLAEYVLAMKHGLGLNKVLGTIHAYPTFAEANKYVAGEWRRAHQPARVMALLRRFHAWRRS
jgi:pyruvate/2-oxoglutarate dehydrogenase complex dihydrolipoamide dehydrogenase (E3) component